MGGALAGQQAWEQVWLGEAVAGALSLHSSIQAHGTDECSCQGLSGGTTGTDSNIKESLHGLSYMPMSNWSPAKIPNQANSRGCTDVYATVTAQQIDWVQCPPGKAIGGNAGAVAKKGAMMLGCCIESSAAKAQDTACQLQCKHERFCIQNIVISMWTFALAAATEVMSLTDILECAAAKA